MAELNETFFGKIFKYHSSKNLEAFQESLGLHAEKVRFINFASDQKIEKQDNSYVFTLVTPAGDKSMTFSSGVEFESNARGTIVKNTFTVDGNCVTHVAKFDFDLTITAKKNFSATKLVEELTHSNWNGVATLTYSA